MTQPHPHAEVRKHGRSLNIVPWTMADEFTVIIKTHVRDKIHRLRIQVIKLKNKNTSKLILPQLSHKFAMYLLGGEGT